MAPCKCSKKSTQVSISLMSALLFFIVANPLTFKFTNKIIGEKVASSAGCPTLAGLLLHSLIFFLITWCLMNINLGKRELLEGLEPQTPQTTLERIDNVKKKLLKDGSKDSLSLNLKELTSAVNESVLPQDRKTDIINSISQLTNVSKTLDLIKSITAEVNKYVEDDKPPLDTRPITTSPSDSNSDIKAYNDNDPDESDTELSTMLGGGLKDGNYSRCDCNNGQKVLLLN